MNLVELEQKIKYEFKNKELLKKALTHTSYAYERGVESNEKLEFLGDSILEFVSSEYLYLNFPKLKEGEMTKIRASYVCENALNEYSLALGLNNYIKVGHGEEKEGGKYKKAIMADIFEARIGAIYVDLGYATARKVVLNIMVPYIEDPNITFFSDYKSTLQEYVQTYQKSLTYSTIKEEGPAHDKLFTVEVMIDDIVYGTGVGTSKKEAEQEAAKNAIKKLAL